jgi:hypothetical protein
VTNPFEQLADRQLNSAAKRKIEKREAKEERVRAIMVPTAREKKQQDAAAQLKLYRAWRSNIKKAVAAAHGSNFAALLRLIRGLEWRDADKVVDFVEGAHWLLEADEDTRLETLKFIDASFIRARIRDGRSPIDDGLPGEPDTPFVMIRWMLMGV